MTRREAEMVAEELYKLLKPTIEEIVRGETRKCTDKVLNAKEAAQLLGWKVGSVYNRTKDLPCWKVGNRLMFSQQQLYDWMRRI